MSGADFWLDKEKANSVLKELKTLRSLTGPFIAANARYAEFKELFDICEKQDEASLSHLNSELDSFKKDLDELEFKTFLSGEFDANNAILSINSGAGGTESCDWAQMLLRMYSRWAQGKNYKVKTIDFLAGEEAGIKNVTVLIEGDFAYGLLKAERGVHRLVRISPFDANKRRHTSFASVDVIPQIQDDVQIDIKPEELKIDVYRSSGAGGQSVNTTDSAVRITHLPSGIVVQCQNERSQYQNKQNALGVLKARLYELKRQKQDAKVSRQYTQKQKIEWGSQIRSYVMQPYSLVKDHRTDFETGNVAAVMDGEIDKFIEAYLKAQK